MRELVLKKCSKCGAMVKVIDDCNCNDCGIKCCNQKMELVKANSTDASQEKHMPTYKIEDDKLIVSLSHVMEDNHYIEWICLITDKKEEYRYFKPNEEVKAIFDKEASGKLYAYCNNHGLWEVNI